MKDDCAECGGTGVREDRGGEVCGRCSGGGAEPALVVRKPRLLAQNWTAADEGITPEDVRGKVEVLPKRTIVQARLRPQIAGMIEDAYHIVKQELHSLKVHQETHDKPISADRLQKLVHSLEKLQSAEIKEEQRHDPTNLPDDALMRDMFRDPVLRQMARKILSEYED